ncbi:MAG: hypothetical protein ABSG63_06145 [Spirochaetia bacterium]
MDAFTPGHDFLMRGGAGTGKTIVLLHAWGRARRDLFTPRTVLLTYTTTLVKYDRYLAELLKASEDPGLIQTADSFFRRSNTGFMSSAELTTEVEDFLFANMVSKSESLEKRVARRGMRRPLSAAQRVLVWQIRDLIA